MKRITIVLTDKEYGDLERLALQERRTPREMAAYFVTRPCTLHLTLSAQPASPRQWWQDAPVTITSEDTGTDITVVPNGLRFA